MQLKLILIMLALVISGCEPPNADSLDRDIAELTGRLVEIDADLAKYEGGLIHDLIMVRKQLTSGTKEMLEQKRASLLYWVDLEYPINGRVPDPASQEMLDQIMTDIELLEGQLAEAKAEARYSGGLIGALKQSQVATVQLSLATVRQNYFATKYGIPIIYGAESDDQRTEREIIDAEDL